MSLRTRLIVAFLLLAVVPLSAVTVYSYWTSVGAFQDAVERESTQTAADIGRRMALVTDDVGRRLDRMFTVSVTAPPGEAPPATAEELRARLAPMLGDAAALVDQVAFQPTSGTAPAPPATAALPPRPGQHPSQPPLPSGAPVPPIVVDVPSILAQTGELLRSAQALPIDSANRARLNEAVRRMVEARLASKEATIASTMAESKVKASAAAAAAGGTALPMPVMKIEGRELAIPVRRNGQTVGHVSARLNLDRALGAILTLTRSDQGEIPFAIDQRGHLYTPNEAQRPVLESLHVENEIATDQPRRVGDWLIVSRKDASGLKFGIARPLGASLREIRRTAVRNLSLGLLVVGLAIIGIVPISHRMTDRLRALTAGVRQLAAGDFHARVQVRSSDEFGELAAAFNQMAADMERHEAIAVEQERLHRELELSRQIQTEMLPHRPLRLGAAEIKGVSIPAREVGGDFFNYFELPSHRLGLLVGDVSGKGVSAALLMANVQATLRARLPLQADLAALADTLDRELDETTPGGVFVTLFIGVLEEDGRMLRYVNAGHNPQYVLRSTGGVERLASAGLPLGLFGGHGYTEARVSLGPGDLLFFYTDGLVETENSTGDMFGAERVEAVLVEEHSRGIDAVLDRITQEVNAFRGAIEPLDDATIMALRV